MVSEGKAHRHKRSRQAGFLFFCLAGEHVCVVPGGLGGRNQPMGKPPSKRHCDAKPRDALCFVSRFGLLLVVFWQHRKPRSGLCSGRPGGCASKRGRRPGVFVFPGRSGERCVLSEGFCAPTPFGLRVIKRHLACGRSEQKARAMTGGRAGMRVHYGAHFYDQPVAWSEVKGREELATIRSLNEATRNEQI